MDTNEGTCLIGTRVSGDSRAPACRMGVVRSLFSRWVRSLLRPHPVWSGLHL